MDDVMQSMNAFSGDLQSFAAQLSISDSGSMSFISGGAYPDLMSLLVTVDRSGRIQTLSSDERPYFSPKISPDGRKVVYEAHGKEKNICVYDINRKSSQNLTSVGVNSWPIWYPDGEKVTFVIYEKNDCRRLVNLPVSGGSPPEPLVEVPSPYYLAPSSWSRDGKTLAYVQESPATGYDIYLYHTEDRKSKRLLYSKFQEGWPAISPNGNWLAYASNSNGVYEVYIRQLQGTPKDLKISNGCGFRPGTVWACDGRELYYPGPNNKMMVVDIPDKPNSDPSMPRELFPIEAVAFGGSPVRAYDAAPDGRLFYATINKQGVHVNGITRINIVQNWFDELKRLVPSGKK
jgi:hypothetical protein